MNATKNRYVRSYLQAVADGRLNEEGAIVRLERTLQDHNKRYGLN